MTMLKTQLLSRLIRSCLTTQLKRWCSIKILIICLYLKIFLQTISKESCPNFYERKESLGALDWFLMIQIKLWLSIIMRHLTKRVARMRRQKDQKLPSLILATRKSCRFVDHLTWYKTQSLTWQCKEEWSGAWAILTLSLFVNLVLYHLLRRMKASKT